MSHNTIRQSFAAIGRKLRTEILKLPEMPATSSTACYMNLGREHWFVCDRHKVKWLVGSNLFSSWRYEDQSEWEQNAQKLAEYTEVLPIISDK